MDISDPNGEYEKILRKYIHDYFVRKKLYDTASTFAHEAEVSENKEDVIDYASQSFLLEWWSVFWALFASTAEGIPQTTAGSSDQSNPDANQWRSLIAFAGEYLRKLRDEKRALGMPSSSHAHAGPSQQQIPDDAQQKTAMGALVGDDLGEPNFVGSTFSGFQSTLADAGLLGAGNSADSIPLQGWPLTGVEIPPSMTFPDSLSPMPHSQQQFMTSMPHQEVEIPPSMTFPDSLSPMPHSQQQFQTSMPRQDTRNAQDPSVAMNTTSGKLEENLTAANMSEQDGFSFQEIHRVHSGKDGIVCCHFSSDGRFLAAASHRRKIHLWSLKGFDCITIGELHSDLITDIRFRPDSSIFATSSFDRTVKMWHANGIKQLFQFVGHTGEVTSVDFDPRNPDNFCSCDSTDEIREWSISITASRGVYKGASRQIRFQPITGDLLAGASGNTVNLFDVKTDKLIFTFEGHVNEVRSICWDKSGEYVASVSEDSARIWSLASFGKCMHVLNSQGNRFGAGIFHPDHPLLLVVGSYQALQLWNPAMSNETMSVPAHENVISALADCRETGVVASAGEDEFVKIWK